MGEMGVDCLAPRGKLWIMAKHDTALSRGRMVDDLSSSYELMPGQRSMEPYVHNGTKKTHPSQQGSIVEWQSLSRLNLGLFPASVSFS